MRSSSQAILQRIALEKDPIPNPLEAHANSMMTSPSGSSRATTAEASHPADDKRDLKDATEKESKELALSQVTQRGIKCNYHIPYDDDLKIDDRTNIGDGGMSFIWKGQWHGMPVAVKARLTDVSEEHEEKISKQFINEVQMLQYLQGLKIPGIIGFGGYAEEHQSGYSDIFVMEYSPNGNLEERILSYANRNEHMPWATCYKIAVDISAILAALHKANILHADIKPRNILVDPIKLIDFGLAKKLLRNKKSITASIVEGTFEYLAPEVIMQRKYSCASDTFAFGHLLFFMAAQRPPFIEKQTKELLTNVAEGKRDKIPDDCPAEFARIIEGCCEQDPDKRPSMQEVNRKLQVLSMNV